MFRMYHFPLSASWTCTVYPSAVLTCRMHVSLSSTPCVLTCRVYPFHQHHLYWRAGCIPFHLPVWTRWVYPFPPPAVWTCIVFVFQVISRREIITVRGQSYVSRLPKYWSPTPLSARRVFPTPPPPTPGRPHCSIRPMPSSPTDYSELSQLFFSLVVANNWVHKIFTRRGKIMTIETFRTINLVTFDSIAAFRSFTFLSEY